MEHRELLITIEMLREIAKTSSFFGEQRFRDLFSSRIRQSTTQATLLSAVEHLAQCLDCSLQYLRGDLLTAFLPIASGPEAPRLLAWLREYPKMAAMLCCVKEDWQEALQGIVLPEVSAERSRVSQVPTYDIPIRITCLTPLAHGDEGKAGNATLFRRGLAALANGQVMPLPFYAGNALRGQLRDLLADDLVAALGLGKKSLSLWFFYCLYSGGALEENSKAITKITKMLGDHGTLITDGLRSFRAHLPSLSLLGLAVGNRILPGRLCVGDARPQCYEWRLGNTPVSELMDWQFLTRREDDEAHNENHSMIATTECLRVGTVLEGGIDLLGHIQPLEAAALGRGLKLLAEKGRLGAENRRGFGKVDLVCEQAPDPAPYTDYLTEHKLEILEYLQQIGAIECTPAD